MYMLKEQKYSANTNINQRNALFFCNKCSTQTVRLEQLLLLVTTLSSVFVENCQVWFGSMSLANGKDSHLLSTTLATSSAYCIQWCRFPGEYVESCCNRKRGVLNDIEIVAKTHERFNSISKTWWQWVRFLYWSVLNVQVLFKAEHEILSIALKKLLENPESLRGYKLCTR